MSSGDYVTGVLQNRIVAALNLHRKVPVYAVPADECDEHDYETHGLELSIGEWVCTHHSHIEEYTCQECAELSEGNANGEYPNFPCPTRLALGEVVGNVEWSREGKTMNPREEAKRLFPGEGGSMQTIIVRDSLRRAYIMGFEDGKKKGESDE